MSNLLKRLHDGPTRASQKCVAKLKHWRRLQNGLGCQTSQLPATRRTTKYWY